MSFVPAPSEDPTKALTEAWEGLKKMDKPTLGNFLKALGPLLSYYLLNDLKPGEVAPAPEAQRSALKASVTPRGPLLALQTAVGKPVPAILPETDRKPPEFKRLGGSLELDVNHFTTPQEFIGKLKHYATSLDSSGRLARTRYEWGGEGDVEGGVDCSGLIMAALEEQLGLARGDATAESMRQHLTAGIKKGAENPRDAKVGDLLFFVPRGGSEATHVAVIAETFGDGRVRVIQSSGGRGYSEDKILNLKSGTPNRALEFGTPRFYRA